MLKYEKYLRQYSRKLRNEMTDAERKLWFYIRKKQINNLQFYRQKPIGNYIVDFYCPAKKIIIELDGGQHYEEKNIKKDRVRDEKLQKLGLKILRFNDRDILLNIEGVIEKILQEI